MRNSAFNMEINLRAERACYDYLDELRRARLQRQIDSLAGKTLERLRKRTAELDAETEPNPEKPR